MAETTKDSVKEITKIEAENKGVVSPNLMVMDSAKEKPKKDNLETENKEKLSDKLVSDEPVESDFEIIATEMEENKVDIPMEKEGKLKVNTLESTGTIQDTDIEKDLGSKITESKVADTTSTQKLSENKPTHDKRDSKDEINDESIGSPEDVVGLPKNKILKPDFQDTETIKDTSTEKVAEKKTTKEESPESSLIDIKIIKESEDSSKEELPGSDSHSSDELEAAMTAIPEMSSSLSKEILAESKDDGEVKSIVQEIERKTEERPEGTLIDITVIEETDKDKNIQEVIKEADNSFEAEVIEDNADIEVVPSDDEEVIEYKLEATDVIPIITIFVALVAIFVALFFYYN